MPFPLSDAPASNDRRRFLRSVGGLGVAAAVGTGLLYSVSAQPESNTRLMVPAGFTPRVIARSGYPVVAGADYLWHAAPDGGACFTNAEPGWVYVSSSETREGGVVSALRFDADGKVNNGYSILTGTRKNCSGGKTPWNTWLSCEEVDDGLVWGCDPFGHSVAVALPGLGAFKHESASVDPSTHQVYLTEDENDGCLYRFTPAEVSIGGTTNLSKGRLQAARIDKGMVSWLDVPDPSGIDAPLRDQLPECTKFRGGEGIDIYDHWVRFTTKRDNRVWQIDLRDDRIEAIYELGGQLNDVDDLIHSPTGKMLIAEDGTSMRVLYFDEMSGPPGLLLQLPDHLYSEITGLAFDSSGERLYFSSHRGSMKNNLHGITFELTGDFSRLDISAPLVEWHLDHHNLTV